MRPALLLLACLGLMACAGDTSPSGRPLPAYGVTGAFSGDAAWGLPAGGGAGPGSMFDQNRPQPFGRGGTYRGNEPAF